MILKQQNVQTDRKRWLVQKLRQLTGHRLYDYKDILQNNLTIRQFQMNLIDILQTENIQDQTKRKAATFLNYSLKKKSQDDDQNRFKMVKSILLNQKISLRHKLILEISLLQIINSDCQSQQVDQFIRITNFLLQSGIPEQRMVSTLIYESIASSEINRIDIIIYFKNTIKFYLQLGCLLLQSLLQIREDYKNFDIQKEKQNLKKQDRQFLMQRFNFLNMWLIAYKCAYNTLSSIMDSTDAQDLINIEFNNKIFFDIITQIYTFDFFKNQKHQINLLICFQDPQFDQPINQIKDIAFQMHRLILQKYNLVQLSSFEMDQALKSLTWIIPSIIQSLRYICRQEFKQIKHEFQDIISSQILLLAKAFSFKNIEKFTTFDFKQIFLDCIFVNLSIQQQQISIFYQDPKQFYDQDLQLFSNRSTKTIANSSADLLQAIINNFDGASSYIFYASLGTVKYILKIGPQLEINNDIIKSNYRPTIQSCFTILIILSHHYLQRKDLYKQMNQFISQPQFTLQSNQLVQLCGLFEGIQKGRFFNFLTCNMDSNLPKQIKGKYLNWAIKTQQIQGACLNFSYEFLANELKGSFGAQIWDIFIEMITRVQNLTFFSMMQNLLNKQLHNLDKNYLIQIISKFVDRGLKLFSQLSKKQNKQKRQIKQKIFQYVMHILYVILQKFQKIYKFDHQGRLIQSIWPIFSILIIQNIQSLYLEWFKQEPLIKILTPVLSLIPYFSQRQFSLLPFFQSNIKNQKNQYLNLLKPLHKYILKSQNYIQKNPLQLNVLCDLIQRGFVPLVDKSSNNYKITIGQACLLEHQLIMNYAHLLNEWDYIRLITQQIFQNEISYEVNCRIINIWLLSYHYNNKFKIQKYIDYYKHFVNSYDIELSIYVIKKMIQTTKLINNSINPLFIQLLNTSIIILHRNQISHKRKNTKKQKCNQAVYRMSLQYGVQELNLTIKNCDPNQNTNQVLKFLQKQFPNQLSNLLKSMKQKNGISIQRLKQIISFVEIQNSARKIVKVNKKGLNIQKNNQNNKQNSCKMEKV